MIAQTLGMFLSILEWIIIIQCLMSWLPEARYSKLYGILSSITEPIVGPIRDLLFRYIDIPVDFSPIIVILIISFIQRLI